MLYFRPASVPQPEREIPFRLGYMAAAISTRRSPTTRAGDGTCGLTSGLQFPLRASPVDDCAEPPGPGGNNALQHYCRPAADPRGPTASRTVLARVLVSRETVRAFCCIGAETGALRASQRGCRPREEILFLIVDYQLVRLSVGALPGRPLRRVPTLRASFHVKPRPIGVPSAFGQVVERRFNVRGRLCHCSPLPPP